MTSDIHQGSLSPEQVAEYTDALTRHYGEPVRPVSQYCNAFTTWRDAIQAKVERLKSGDELANMGEEYRDREIAEWEPVLNALATVALPVYKSNLLARLIYGGERLRTRMCPVHKGQWSGCQFEPIECGCGAGANVTGWLAETLEDQQHYVGGPIPVTIKLPGGDDTMAEALALGYNDTPLPLPESPPPAREDEE